MIRTLCVAASFLGVIGIGFASPASADDDDPASDALFSHLLDHDGLLFNFRLEKREGQSYCEDIIRGEDPVEATNDLARNGSYSFDVANGISSSASVAYCECAFARGSGVPVNQGVCRPFELSYGRHE